MTNQTLANFIAMFFASSGSNSGLLIDYNVVDGAYVYGQGAAISGIPQDPGDAGTISNITIDHNTVRGGSAIIAATDYYPEGVATSPDETQTYNIQITNNTLEGQTGGNATIDVSGGDTGSVNGAVVSGNVFSPGPSNSITQDDHSYNVSVGNNSL